VWCGVVRCYNTMPVHFIGSAQPGCYSFSTPPNPVSVSQRPDTAKGKSQVHCTYLPPVHFLLLLFILLQQLFQHLLQAVGVGLERRQHIFDGALHQHAVDQPEALARWWEGGQRFADESSGRCG